MKNYAKNGRTDYKKEKEIIASTDTETLIEKLTPYLIDSAILRQKAYYLMYSSTMHSKKCQTRVINILTKGCTDKDMGVVSQNIAFLKRFNKSDFDEQSLNLLTEKLQNSRVPYYKDYVLLAGFLSIGRNILYQKFIDPNTNQKLKWNLSLALARMGNQENISYCMNKVKSLPINDNVVDYAVPDLVYMRQKESIDFCIAILNGEEKLCHSLNPDISESIHCGYRIIEILSPIIEGIPTLNENLNLSSDDYEKKLVEVRQWFTNNPNYTIQNSYF